MPNPSETAGEPAAVPPPTPGRAAGERDLARITRQAFFDARRVAVRDSKQPDGPWLAFTPAAWREFTRRLK